MKKFGGQRNDISFSKKTIEWRIGSKKQAFCIGFSLTNEYRVLVSKVGGRA